MPWKVAKNHSDCPASKPYAVVKKGAKPTKEGCHPTREAANKQLAALYASEADHSLAQLADDLVEVTMAKPSTVTPADRRLKQNKKKPARTGYATMPQGDCPPGQHAMPDGECMPDEMMAEADIEHMAGPFEHWTGVLALEGIETGDGREFAPDSLDWPDPPLPLMWQRQSEPQHMRSVVVGRIDRIERQGDEIRGWGVIDLGNPDGAEVARQMANETAGGVSVDVDSVKEPDVELVFPDNPDQERVSEDDGNNIVMLFGPPPEKTIFHKGRIRGATLVALPAFVQARLRLVSEEEFTLALSHTFAAIGTHHTATSDGSWDGPANEARLPSPMSVSVAQDAYAWMENGAADNGEIRKNACRFIHHEVSAGGDPGAASLTACSTGIGVLNGGRGGTTIPAADRRGVYNHLAGHLRDAGRTPPPLMDTVDTLVAAGGPMYPPAGWFRDPQLAGPTPWSVGKDGKVFGHLALWGSCHMTFPDRCVTPPKEGDYPYFMSRELEADNGEMIGTGRITLGTGHAPLHLGHVPAAEHYDDTGTAVVDICVGEDRWGIWVAGALRPGVSDLQVRTLRGASLSGDWRRIGGKLRLVAVLAVNVPGFPIPRMRATLAADEVASLVAAGIPTDARREKYRHLNVQTLPDGTIRVRKAAAISKGD